MMTAYFPRHTREMQAVEPPGFRRLTLSLVEMALITGAVVRLLRAITVSYGPAANWVYISLAIIVGALVLFGMTALHLANFTLRKWIWRAPLFAVVEVAAEMVVSAGLILLGREPLGTDRASMDQWWALAGQTLLSRTAAICAFALLLAGVIHVTRRIVIAREPNARAAESLRAELYSEASEPEIDSSRTG